MSNLNAAQSRVVGAPTSTPGGVAWPHIPYEIHDLGVLPFDEIYRLTGLAGNENRARKIPNTVGYAAVVQVENEHRPAQRWYAMCDGAGMWAGDRDEAEREIRRHVNFHANFWMEKVQWRLWGDRKERGRGNPVIRCDGTHYVIGDPSGGESVMRGFGGRKFEFWMLADGERITSTNVWFQGIIPAEFRELLPDNAASSPLSSRRVETP